MALRVQALSIVDAIADDIRGNLFNGMLRSDTQLTEAEVAASYEVARPTAKAAIEKLVAEGLLLRGTHKTARVPAIGPDEVRDLYFARVCIESEVVRRLAASRTLPDTARRANDEVTALEPSSGMEVAEPVIRFHLGLINALDSPRLTRLFSTLMGEMRLCMAQMNYRRLLQAPAIAEEHKVILRAIASGDPDGAVAALQDHLRKAENRIVPTLEALAAKARESQRG
jgi:DNA-binding GntR family transcriptional regulator